MSKKGQLPLAMHRVTDDESVEVSMGLTADVRRGMVLDHRKRREWLDDCRSVTTTVLSRRSGVALD